MQETILREHRPTITDGTQAPTFSNSIWAHLSDSCLHRLENVTLNCFDAKVQENAQTFLFPLRQPTILLSEAHIRAYLPKNDFISLDDIIEDFWQDV